ncbi:MAG: hypothetical protein H5U40_16845, partial [Polyangiaceae bacterium]|nr:hypothetical protein [Polyangiaceae bacterium]
SSVRAGDEIAAVQRDVQRARAFQVVDSTGSVIIDHGDLELWIGINRASDDERVVRLCEGDLVDAVAVGRWEVAPELEHGYRTGKSVYRLIGRPGTPIHLRLSDAASVERERTAVC